MFYYQHLPIYLLVFGKVRYTQIQPHKFITLEQIPHPIHSSSDIKAILSAGDTSMHNFPKKKYTFSHLRSRSSK